MIALTQAKQNFEATPTELATPFAHRASQAPQWWSLTANELADATTTTNPHIKQCTNPLQCPPTECADCATTNVTLIAFHGPPAEQVQESSHSVAINNLRARARRSHVNQGASPALL